MAKNILQENRESKNISLARKYLVNNGMSQERAQDILDVIRHDIPNSRIADCKFLLGVTRMYRNGELNDYSIISEINRTLKFVGTGTHVNEYSNDLNGMSAEDLVDRFSTTVQDDLENDRKRSENRNITEKSRYNIVRIPNFETAEDYSRYTEWCVTKERSNYDGYTNGGTGIFYFCLAEGFENVEKIKGENCPLDEYGLSMIAVSVNADGSCNTITCRWNHDNGGSDDVMSVEQLENIVSVKFYQTFKPRTKEEALAESSARAEYVLSYLNDEVGEHEAENMEEFGINGRKLYVWNGADSWNEPEISYSVILEIGEYGYSLAYDYAFAENITELVPSSNTKCGFNVITGWRMNNVAAMHLFNTDTCEYVGGMRDVSTVIYVGDKLCVAFLNNKKLNIISIDGEVVYSSAAFGGLLTLYGEPYNLYTKTDWCMYFINKNKVMLIDTSNNGFNVVLGGPLAYSNDGRGSYKTAMFTNDNGEVYIFSGLYFLQCPMNPVQEYYFVVVTDEGEELVFFRKNNEIYKWSVGKGCVESDMAELTKYDSLRAQNKNRYNEEVENQDNMIEEDVSAKPFEPKDELNPKFWVNNKLNSRVRLRLLDIADDFVKTLDIRWVKPDDIVLTGSIANYNWTKFSDVDIHIIMDYKKVYDKTDFVKNYFDAKKEEWNTSHEKLRIYGFNVELSVEDLNKPAQSSGVYSLEKNEWVKEPKDLSDAKLNREYVESTAEKYIEKIDKLEAKLKKEKDAKKVEIISDKMVAIFDKLKGMRKEGLKTKAKEMSSGNIIWKILRAEGYIKKIWDVVNYNYDRSMSLNEGYWGYLPLQNDYVLDDLNGEYTDSILKFAKKLKKEYEKGTKNRKTTFDYNDIFNLLNDILYLVWSAPEWSIDSVNEDLGFDLDKLMLSSLDMLDNNTFIDGWKEKGEIKKGLSLLKKRITDIVCRTDEYDMEEIGREFGFVSEAVTGKDNKNAAALYVYALDSKNGKWNILCAKRAQRKGDDEKGKWNPPMGHLHRGENMLDGAIRECMEESGIDFTEYKSKIRLMDTHRWGNNYRLVIHGKLTSDFKPGKGDEENEKFIWLPVDKIDEKEWAWSCGENADKFKPKTVTVNENQLKIKRYGHTIILTEGQAEKAKCIFGSHYL